MGGLRRPLVRYLARHHDAVDRAGIRRSAFRLRDRRGRHGSGNRAPAAARQRACFPAIGRYPGSTLCAVAGDEHLMETRKSPARGRGAYCGEASWDEAADVVVVGYGYAGAGAAIQAHDGGAEWLLREQETDPG